MGKGSFPLKQPRSIPITQILPLLLLRKNLRQILVMILRQDRDKLERRKREVTPIQHPVHGRILEQARNLFWERPAGRVEVELAAEALLDDVHADDVAEAEDWGGGAEAPQHRRQRPAAVRQDVRDVREALDGPRQEEVDDAARGVEEELEHRPREVRERQGGLTVGHAGCGRVDENDRLAPVQLLEYRVEVFVAQVFAVVVRLEDDPVGVELVECVLDLGESAFDVRQGR